MARDPSRPPEEYLGEPPFRGEPSRPKLYRSDAMRRSFELSVLFPNSWPGHDLSAPGSLRVNAAGDYLHEGMQRAWVAFRQGWQSREAEAKRGRA